MSTPAYHARTHLPGGTDPLDWEGVMAGPWITPTLLNGWEDVGAPFCAFAYRKLFNGTALEFRGRIENGYDGSVAFQLPADDRLDCDSVAGALVEITGGYQWGWIYFDMSTGDVTVHQALT